MPWYRYRQNNSYGKYVGPIEVLVEAADWQHANMRVEIRAPRHEIYFDGCQLNVDCGCCGDRWSRLTPLADHVGDYEWSRFDSVEHWRSLEDMRTARRVREGYNYEGDPRCLIIPILEPQYRMGADNPFTVDEPSDVHA